MKHGLVAWVRDWPFLFFHRDVRRELVPADWAGEMAEGNFGELGGKGSFLPSRDQICRAIGDIIEPVLLASSDFTDSETSVLSVLRSSGWETGFIASTTSRAGYVRLSSSQRAICLCAPLGKATSLGSFASAARNC